MIYQKLRQLMLPLSEIDTVIPKKGNIVELGCGQGVIAQYLAQTKTRNVLGLDSNKKRLPAIKTKNLKFVCADMRTYKLGKVDGVVISDVLHHVSFSDQEKILQQISKHLSKNGVLVIKEIDTNEKIRSKFSRLWDFLLYPKDLIYFSHRQQLTKMLKRQGFSVSFQKAARLFPGSTNLYIATK